MQTVSPPAGFVDTLYQQAGQYFKTKRNGPYATPFGLLKSCCIVLFYIVAYSVFLFKEHSFLSLLGWAALLGICHVLIPVNIAHDAIHGSFSQCAWLNKLGLYSMDITGANSYMYKKKHLEAHRNKEQGNTLNTIETQGLLMQKEEKNTRKNLPYLFYLFYAQYMLFIRDFHLFYSEKSPIPKVEWQKLFVGKFLYATAFLVLPFVFINLPAWQILCALLLQYLVVTVLLVLILLMPTGKMEHSRLAQNNHYNDKWAIEILAHYVDFSPGSRLLNHIAGGANLNVVHYLFPGVNHVHYHILAKLVEKTAREHNLLYRKQNVKDVVGIHLTYIKNIDQQESSLTPKAG